MLMKDKVFSPHLYKKSFLNRSVEKEERRTKHYKKFISQGMNCYDAYKKSLRRIGE
tara:strand:- start:20438 stop:20605 length:168 start_codon:yes stop_codon:yes gene_type:complete